MKYDKKELNTLQNVSNWFHSLLNSIFEQSLFGWHVFYLLISDLWNDDRASRFYDRWRTIWWQDQRLQGAGCSSWRYPWKGIHKSSFAKKWMFFVTPLTKDGTVYFVWVRRHLSANFQNYWKFIFLHNDDLKKTTNTNILMWDTLLWCALSAEHFRMLMKKK